MSKMLKCLLLSCAKNIHAEFLAGRVGVFFVVIWSARPGGGDTYFHLIVLAYIDRSGGVYSLSLSTHIGVVSLPFSFFINLFSENLL